MSNTQTVLARDLRPGDVVKVFVAVNPNSFQHEVKTRILSVEHYSDDCLEVTFPFGSLLLLSGNCFELISRGES